MKIKRRLSVVLILVSLLAISLSINTFIQGSIRQSFYFEPLSSLHIPDGVRVVGFGEASHGNHEFKYIANEVFKRLVLENGFRAFATEVSFGVGMSVNEYILYGIGTAEEVVSYMGDWIHNSQEVIDLVEWMREFNLTAEEGDEVRFYGFDFHRINISRQRYLAFMETVNPERAIRDKVILEIANIETIRLPITTDKEAMLESVHNINRIIDEIRQNRDHYILASSEIEFEFALRNLYEIKFELELTILEVSEPWRLADEYRGRIMFENLLWIIEHEENLGRGRIFAFAHHGHIMKSPRLGAQSFGGNLFEHFGEAYFAIGTQFRSTTTIAPSQREQRFVEHSVTNRWINLIRAFNDTDMDIGLIDINRHVEYGGAAGRTLNRRQLSAHVGVVHRYFGLLGPLRQHSFVFVPSDSFDVIIFVQYATPAHFIEGI